MQLYTMSKMLCEENVNVVTRDMGVDDLPEVLSIEAVSFPRPWTEGMFREELRSPLCRTRVAEVKGRIIGYISYSLILDEIHLRNIAVRTGWQRQGIASVLLEEMFDGAVSRNIRWATLEVRPSNMAALQLYKKFLFSVRGIRRNYYTETGEDAIILWADVSGIMKKKK